MPTGNLPESATKLWESVYEASKDAGDDESKAAKKAWGAVKNAGWHKNDSGEWVKGAELLEEFSLTIRKASFDKATGEMRWRADASDIDADTYDDNMAAELFDDFIERINRNEMPPEPIRDRYTSDFWSCGMPYLSLSHYPDMNGDAVPGSVDAVFVDGKFLKTKGRMYDTPLGNATWNALRNDLEKRGDVNHAPVRVSIAFLDYKHRHKDTGTVFERDFSDPTKIICPECVENNRVGKNGGKVFLKGLLIHLAMTRVPVNKRTRMEVERAMTTRKEDAASIVGEELAEQIDNKALEIGRSDFEITRSDDVIDDVDTSKSYDGEYRPYGGATSMRQAKEVMEAEKERYRITDLWWAFQDVVSNILSDETITDKAGSFNAVLDEFKEMLGSKEAIHMSEVVYALRSEYEARIAATKPPKDAEDESEEDEEDDGAEVMDAALESGPDIAEALSLAMRETNQKLDLLITAISQRPQTSSVVPERRSITAASIPQLSPGQSDAPNPGKPIKIQDFVRRSVIGQ